ncbi:MAG: DUF2934 domain-containing protein [Janthinobacterium lividum]
MGKQSSEDAIRTRAYHLWEDDGRPAGRADEYWEKARALVESTPVAQSAEPTQGTDAPPKSARVKKATSAGDADAAGSPPTPAEKPAATKRAAPKRIAGDVPTTAPVKKSGKKTEADAVTTTAAKPTSAAKPAAKTAAKTASGETVKPARKTATAAGGRKAKAD